jgi:hypothetical protein
LGWFWRACAARTKNADRPPARVVLIDDPAGDASGRGDEPSPKKPRLL